MTRIRYFGHSAVRIDSDSASILIDPFITGNPHTKIGLESFKNVDAIVLTHGHADHIGDAESIAKSSGATIVSNFEIANYFAAKGFKTHSMHVGGGADFEFGRIKFTIAHHGSSGPNGEYLGAPMGVVVSMGGKSIYHAGDTGLFYDMKLIGELNGPIEMALLPIGDNFTMGIDDALVAAKLIRAKLTVPIHYNTWPPIESSPEEFVRRATEQGLNAQVLEFDKARDL